MTTIPARPGPALVHSHDGAIDELLPLLRADGVRRALFVHGTRSLRAASPYLPHFEGIELLEAEFRGECSPSEIERLSRLVDDSAVNDSAVDAVIGLGGGKVLDTSKAVGHSRSLPIYLIPTLASTCSGWSAVSVYYDDEHRHLGHDVWDTPARALLLDPRIVFDSPIALFVSGLADTLAKHVETRAAFAREAHPSALGDIGALAAARCGEQVRDLGARAVEDMRRGERSAAWTTLAEAAVITSGLVGSFGGAHGRATAAHPINDGLSALPGTRDVLHGIKVAYGVLVQLVLEGRWAEIDALRELYGQWGLPRRLSDLGVSVEDAESLTAIAAVATGPHSSAHLLHPPPTADDIVAAIRALEVHQADLDAVTPIGLPPAH